MWRWLCPGTTTPVQLKFNARTLHCFQLFQTKYTFDGRLHQSFRDIWRERILIFYISWFQWSILLCCSYFFHFTYHSISILYSTILNQTFLILYDELKLLNFLNTTNNNWPSKKGNMEHGEGFNLLFVILLATCDCENARHLNWISILNSHRNRMYTYKIRPPDTLNYLNQSFTIATKNIGKTIYHASSHTYWFSYSGSILDDFIIENAQDTRTFSWSQ